MNRTLTIAYVSVDTKLHSFILELTTKLQLFQQFHFQYTNMILLRNLLDDIMCKIKYSFPNTSTIIVHSTLREKSEYFVYPKY